MTPVAAHKHVACTDFRIIQSTRNHCFICILNRSILILLSTAEKMYELTIDGVPFSLLQPHNPYPPRRPGISKDSGGARQASTRKFPDSGQFCPLRMLRLRLKKKIYIRTSSTTHSLDIDREPQYRLIRINVCPAYFVGLLK